MLRLLLLAVFLAAPTLAADAAPTPTATQPTPSLAARRDMLKEQLGKLIQQQAQLGMAIEQTRGAIAVLSEYAPDVAPAPPAPK